MTVKRPGAAALVLAALASTAPLSATAAPDPAVLLSRAQEEMLQLDFERAIQLLESAVATGRNDRERLIVIYRALAESRAALGQAGRAEWDFRRLLSLDPHAELPRGSSPKLTAPFEAARDFMRGRQPLAITCEQRGDLAILSVLSDPADLVAAGRPTRADGSSLAGAQQKGGRNRIALALPPGPPRALACAALDRHGNELARAALTSSTTSSGTSSGTSSSTTTGRVPAAPGPGEDDTTGLLPPGEPRPPGVERPPPGRRLVPRPPRAAKSPSRPLHARWWLWGAGATVAAGVGGYWALRVQEDEDQWRAINHASEEHSFADALAVQKRGERHARYCNIAFAASGALTAVSAVFLVYDVASETSPRSREPIVRVGAGPLPGGGAAATLRLRF